MAWLNADQPCLGPINTAYSVAHLSTPQHTYQELESTSCLLMNVLNQQARRLLQCHRRLLTPNTIGRTFITDPEPQEAQPPGSTTLWIRNSPLRHC